MEIHSRGWACQDCTFLLANGDTPVDWTEEETEQWLAEIARRCDELAVVLGGEHEDDCPNIAEDGSWLGHADCYCERDEFSSVQCATCGTTLAGYRHAVTFFALPEPAGLVRAEGKQS